MNNSIEDKNVLLAVENLKVHFPIKVGMFRRIKGYVKAVDGLNFNLRKGETFGLVGESGCGKTTTGRSLIKLVEPTAGNVLYKKNKNETVDISKVNKQKLDYLRRDIQMIFQDPYSSLNPRMTVYDIIAEPMRIYNIGNKKSRKEKVAELLESVNLSASYMERYPNEFSGGQRQRIGIARALSLDPKIIICDEPVSALDVSVQAQIINLLEELQEKLDLTFLFIAHDMSVIHHISDRVGVMYLGKIVEIADHDELFQNPKHPYTEALLSAIPSPDPKMNKDQILMEGDVPDPSNPPTGCSFSERCNYAKEICFKKEPELDKLESGHSAACHFAEELDLQSADYQYKINLNY